LGCTVSTRSPAAARIDQPNRPRHLSIADAVAEPWRAMKIEPMIPRTAITRTATSATWYQVTWNSCSTFTYWTREKSAGFGMTPDLTRRLPSRGRAPANVLLRLNDTATRYTTG